MHMWVVRPESKRNTKNHDFYGLSTIIEMLLTEFPPRTLWERISL